MFRKGRAGVALRVHRDASGRGNGPGAGSTSTPEACPAAPRLSRNAPPTVPESIDTKPPKTGHGKNRVSVHETGTTRHQYVAEQSVDGTTWTALGTGRGKSRVLTGASGAKIWVRFAMVRSGMQSDWCTPVLVTIP